VPETPQGTAAQGNQSDAAAAGAASGSDSPEARLSAILDENRKLKERYDNAQRVIGQQGQELGTLRSRVRTVNATSGYEPEEAPAQPSGDGYAKRFEVTDQRLDVIQYRQEYGDWNQFQPAVDVILNDPVKVYDVAAWKPDGFGGVVVDWYRTYRAARERVELDRYRTAQAAAAEAQGQQDEQRTTLKTMGTMTGNAAATQDREMVVGDLKGKSAKQIAEIAAKAGLVPANDPPSTLR